MVLMGSLEQFGSVLLLLVLIYNVTNLCETLNKNSILELKIVAESRREGEQS